MRTKIFKCYQTKQDDKMMLENISKPLTVQAQLYECEYQCEKICLVFGAFPNLCQLPKGGEWWYLEKS